LVILRPATALCNLLNDLSELQPPPELPAVPAPKSDTAPDWIRSHNQRYRQLYRAA